MRGIGANEEAIVQSKFRCLCSVGRINTHGSGSTKESVFVCTGAHVLSKKARAC